MSAAARASLRGAYEAECESARFAAYLAHEVRTPLATQRALLELALADPHADATSWREIGVDVLDACKQQERLLDACVALARSQSGLARCERLDLGSIVSDLLGDRDLGELTARSTLESAPITGDPILIERLVDNLLANAVRHNKPGGWVEVTTRQSGTTSWFTVENTGPPIPARELTRLFEPFHQVADARHARRRRPRTGACGRQGCRRRARRRRHGPCSPRRRSASRGRVPACRRMSSDARIVGGQCCVSDRTSVLAGSRRTLPSRGRTRATGRIAGPRALSPPRKLISTLLTSPAPNSA